MSASVQLITAVKARDRFVELHPHVQPALGAVARVLGIDGDEGLRILVTYSALMSRVHILRECVEDSIAAGRKP